MAITDLSLNYKYRSDQNILYKDFYEPCLCRSVAYDRAAGYFSSHSLKTMARGLEYFLFNGGRVRIVANPHLNEGDIEAILKGYHAKEDVIERALLREMEISETTIEDDTLNVLAWLIYNGQLEIKIAYTENNSLYHEKFGIFRDSGGNSIAFSGSSNETLGGIRDNFEKVDVFLPDKDQHRIDDMINDFQKLWYNRTKGLKVIDVPNSIKQKLLDRKGVMPKQLKKKAEIQARTYQVNAIEALQRNEWSGILEMATGTGKTITSLLAIQKFKKQSGRVFLVIYAPFTHLVEQWRSEVELFNYSQITLCYGAKSKWQSELTDRIRKFNLGIIQQHVVIATYKTATSTEFTELMKKIYGPSALIADECHYLGSQSFRNIEFNHFDVKIGLSATPDRWWDESGTNFLKSVFEKVVYEYTLEQAIVDDKLTKYRYTPHIVNLTEDELQSYQKLTAKIVQQYHSKKPDEDRIERLNRQRSLILAKAEQKIGMLLQLLSQQKIEQIQHTLVYCAENQVSILTRELADLGLRVHKFDSTVPTKERQVILKAFARKEIQVLVAIKCLDEGVDVPSTKCAYFLASTSNPREFVQRRGRILRKSPGKVLAEIHDFIVLPEDIDEATFTMIAKKELPRFAEFSSVAINQYEAKNVLLSYIDPYNLNYLMDMKPWEVYHLMKEESDRV
ncbi:hypothetical protein COE30_07645 [Bacillus cereus]|uniref:DEAD/DEAH box helicase family protein n=1 Tax=Bacillus cereus TaxID=1396 RepID=UPI000BFBAA4B|nr:DEAD/DEAH box helicase family protein [Bacillus cereus]PGZ09661.1 hypothetical protein COE30_07645 [Bacillus cereus]